MIAAMKSWDIDVVRVPLNEDCWLGLMTSPGLGGRPYRRIVERVRARADRAAPVRDPRPALGGAGRRRGRRASCRWPTATTRPRSGARSRGRSSRSRSDVRSVQRAVRDPWGCWLHGCRVAARPGCRRLTRRRACRRWSMLCARPARPSRCCWAACSTRPSSTAGPRTQPHDPLHQLIAAEHNYGGLSPCDARLPGGGRWRRSAAIPVLFGELGETDCADGYIDRMMAWADAHGIGYLGWAWDATSPGAGAAAAARR